MADYNDFTTTAQNVFDNAVKATGEFVNSSKLKIERMNLRSAISRQYEKLGKIAYKDLGYAIDSSEAASSVASELDKLIADEAELTEKINAAK